MIRLVAAACGWMTTADLRIVMFWILTVGAYVGGLAEGNAGVDEAILTTTSLEGGMSLHAHGRADR